MTKRILLITYHFAPEPTPRAFRWNSLVNFFSKKGYLVDILLPGYKNFKPPEISNVNYYQTKRELMYSFIYKFKSKNKKDIESEPMPYFKNSNFFKKTYGVIIKKFFWPDYSGPWYFFAKKKAQELILKYKYDCIISSSSPFTSHLVGCYIKERLKNVRWIGEYSDPFSFNPEKSESIFSFFNKYKEKKILERMNYIIVPSVNAKNGFLEKFPLLADKKIKVVPPIVSEVKSDPDKVNWKYFNDNRINIVYTGVFYKSIRNPEKLLIALKKIKQTDYQSYQKLRFHIFGGIDGATKMIFENYRELLEDKVIILYGLLPKEVCAFACEKADFLLSIANISKYQVPSKIFDYLPYKKPIISLENDESNSPDWKIMIKVDYNVKNLILFLKKLPEMKMEINPADFDRIIKRHRIDNVGERYIRLIAE